jgi:carboxypeptidase family protein
MMRFWVVAALSCACVIAQEEPGSISGTVVDASGAVIPNASVFLSGIAGREIRTNSTGVFVFSNLHPGSYKLKLQLPGFQDKTMSIEVNSGSETHVDVIMQIGLAPCPPSPSPKIVLNKLRDHRTARFSGAAKSNTGSAFPGVQFILRPTTGSGRTFSAVTDDAGNFRMVRVSPGFYNLVFQTKEYAPAMIPNIPVHEGYETIVAPVLVPAEIIICM